MRREIEIVVTQPTAVGGEILARKTVNQILKQALFDILANAKGAYSASVTLELRGRR